ncbi:YvcK family protein [Candidatus Woesebacteria bacterium]|nr:YvcK family protein [Candidatus Woesebacteria bacterium]
MARKKKKIAVIGGGTGTYTVLDGLKKYPVHLSAIITMMDSGGSNRIIRDEFGLLPTSDIRQCMVALASEKSHELLRRLFTYRYNAGTGISGMTFGNLFMAALTDIYGFQEKAIEKTCEMLDVRGEIFPVTFDSVQLVAKYDNGRQVLGEHYIDEPEEELGEHKIIELEVVPEARVNKKAIKAIRKADIIVLGPGDLYTSTICNLVIDGVAEEVAKSKAKKVFVLNLMTKFGQTHGFSTRDHIETLEKYLGKGAIDYCLINRDNSYPKKILERYREENAFPVKDDLKTRASFKVIRKVLSSDTIYEKPKSDRLKRSLIRHDSEKLARAIISLL